VERMARHDSERKAVRLCSRRETSGFGAVMGPATPAVHEVGL